jgi:hypothetical protein
MRKLKNIVAVLMLLFVLGLAAPQAFAGDVLTPGFTGDVQTPGITGDIQGVGLLSAILFGISWSG